MARPSRRARERRQAHPGWRITPGTLTAIVCSLTILGVIIGPVRAWTQISEGLKNQAVSTEKLAASVEKLSGEFKRVADLERAVAVLNAKVGVR
jgi:hypothetical protein